MNIDNRLKRITDFIPSDSYILDVGCDHALLDIYLALNRKNVKLIASDINENPLKKAQEKDSKKEIIKYWLIFLKLLLLHKIYDIIKSDYLMLSFQMQMCYNYYISKKELKNMRQGILK